MGDDFEMTIYGAHWSALGRISAGISTLLYTLQARKQHPNRFEFLRGWIEKMNEAKWLSDQEIEDAWRYALGL